MGVKERRERERTETRNKILDAARELFAARGYEAVTMRSIAEKIDYTPTCIYFHFADKDALIREICRHDFLEFAQEFRQSAECDDAFERLRRLSANYLKFAVTHPNHYRLMFMTPPAFGPEEMGLNRDDPAENAYAFLLACAKDAIASGRLRPEIDDPDLLAQLLWAGMHGVVSLYIAKGGSEWVNWAGLEKTARVMTDALMRGLLKQADATTESAAS